ncbi:MAG: hypothetical protein AAGF84_01385 [Planctomycetota bacterium]
MSAATEYLGLDAYRDLPDPQAVGLLGGVDAPPTYPQHNEMARAISLKANLAKKDCRRLFCEGDSWFDFPGLLIPGPYNDIPDVLDKKHGYAVRRVSDAGDTLANMSRQENLDQLKTKMAHDRPDVLLLSGGGNDLFAGGKSCASQLHDMLRYAKPDDPIDLDRMNGLIEYLASCAVRIMNVADGLSIPTIIHGYAQPPEDVFGKPACKGIAGPWIAPVLKCKGYSPKQHGSAILKILIDAFNQRLQQLADARTDTHYLDLRETLAEPGLWRDELHLINDGWEAAADAFQSRIEQVITV